ncbi:hypothetical protein [Flavobacterium lacus]|uniref:Uncharacterized protein n=1 Tax=Flavobacterium lacus TaxID=1353778 RepID=A0A328X1A5_9FLAO|nr:hypothetical protein [Flavobacterium lacus]RAR51136.1 hypothetical protein B0I10_101312 [Flavobacterium lacus]
MKNFLFKIVLFSALLTAAISFILIGYGGNVDYFYLKFTTPKQSSFILGDSRSMQGIQPRVINEYFVDNEFDLPMFNYSFTITQAAYGPPYTQSVKNKLLSTTKNGLFILSVHPWLFAQREADNFDRNIFAEENTPPHNMRFVTMNPNFEYLFKNFHYFHFKAIIKKNSELHKDGWLEEKNLPKDTLTLNKWKKNQIDIYNGFANRWKKCSFRMEEFEKMIVFLQNHGKVVLVRMPIDQELLDIEQNFWVGFDDDIKALSTKRNVSFIDFSKNNIYQTYDGNHIDKFGGVSFTKALCDSIKKSL